jgi:hypothetical protein
LPEEETTDDFSDKSKGKEEAECEIPPQDNIKAEKKNMKLVLESRLAISRQAQARLIQQPTAVKIMAKAVVYATKFCAH